jgi:hypothetical protein
LCKGRIIFNESIILLIALLRVYFHRFFVTDGKKSLLQPTPPSTKAQQREIRGYVPVWTFDERVLQEHQRT